MAIMARGYAKMEYASVRAYISKKIVYAYDTFRSPYGNLNSPIDLSDT